MRRITSRRSFSGNRRICSKISEALMLSDYPRRLRAQAGFSRGNCSAFRIPHSAFP
jgi:hypothetical protein